MSICFSFPSVAVKGALKATTDNSFPSFFRRNIKNDLRFISSYYKFVYQSCFASLLRHFLFPSADATAPLCLGFYCNSPRESSGRGGQCLTCVGRSVKSILEPLIPFFFSLHNLYKAVHSDTVSVLLLCALTVHPSLMGGWGELMLEEDDEDDSTSHSSIEVSFPSVYPSISAFSPPPSSALAKDDHPLEEHYISNLLDLPSFIVLFRARTSIELPFLLVLFITISLCFWITPYVFTFYNSFYLLHLWFCFPFKIVVLLADDLE